MSMPIQTNQINVEINYSKLEEKYDFFVISTSKDYIKSGAKVLDSPLSEIRVLSILFTKGRSFYVMMNKCPDNKRDLIDIIRNCDDGKYLTLSQIKSCELKKDYLLQLLFNQLSNCNNSILSYNNLTGHLYCFHPKWLKHMRTGEKDEIIKVPCLEINVKGDKILLNVRTFSSTKLKGKITFKKKRFEDYPKYAFSSRNALKRVFNITDEPCFIQRQTDGSKTEIPFLDIQNIDKFQSSKMGILEEIIERFNNTYADSVKVNFVCIDEFERIDHKKADDKNRINQTILLLKSQNIRIVDQIGDNYSSEFCKKIADLFYSKYDIKPRIGTRLSKKGLNVAVIHNEAYYIDTNDPHESKKEGYAVQHITFEDFADCAEYAISTVVNELIIKDDLRSKKISLFDWKALSIDEDIIFVTEKTEDEFEKYVFMKIHKDGSFEIKECKLDLFNADDYLKFVNIYEDAKSLSENICGIICDDSGNVNIIKNTNFITIPNIHRIKEELSSGNTKLRGKKAREDLLDSILDIKWFKKDNGIYYFSNDIGMGMRWAVQRAANIRQIVPYNESKLLFDNIAPTLDVTFVRNGQLTVIPFPFKYLREYIEQKNS